MIVVGDASLPRVQNTWRELDQFLSTRSGVEVVGIDDSLGSANAATPPGTDADLVVVLGGDGAILRACRQMGTQQIPIMGVNLGRLGFLAEMSPAEFFEQFDKIQSRQYYVVQHLMFECTLTRANGVPESFLGLNEVVVASGAALRMIDVQLAINDEPVTTYSGDGLIISTPVGSTAHNLSAGGPILRQDLQAFVITPICPHTLTNRPLVDHADCLFTVRVPELPAGVTLVIDGQIRLPLASGDRIDVRKAAVSFQMAKVPGHSDYATLHRKLGWGGQPQYRPR